MLEPTDAGALLPPSISMLPGSCTHGAPHLPDVEQLTDINQLTAAALQPSRAHPVWLKKQTQNA